MDTKMEIQLMKYREYLVRKQLSDSTQDIYMREAKRFLEYSKNKEIHGKIVEAYALRLKETYKIRTANLYTIALNVYLKYIGRNDCVVRTEHIQPRRSLENVINMQEYRKMLSYAKESDRYKYYLIIKTLATTGIRIGELKYLKVSNISAGSISVVNKGRCRDIYLPDELILELKRYCESENVTEGAIFRGRDENPISRVAIWLMLQKMADMLGLPCEKLHPHSFRHFFAKSYIEKYGNLAELADILGHSSIEVTRIYTTSTVEEKRKKLGELGM